MFDQKSSDEFKSDQETGFVFLSVSNLVNQFSVRTYISHINTLKTSDLLFQKFVIQAETLVTSSGFIVFSFINPYLVKNTTWNLPILH